MPLEMNLYPELKKRGLITLARFGGAYAAAVNRFDANTGEPLNDEVIAIDMASVEKSIADISADKAALELLKADLLALG